MPSLFAKMTGALFVSTFFLTHGDFASAQSPQPAEQKWTNGLPDDPDHFPIAVWLQAPRNASKYKEIGINLFVGLWEGPTEAQLKELEKAGMPVICDQNELALANLDRKIIVGWMHGDEPDNAQLKPTGKGYDPPILPSVIQTDYQRIQKADPTRPILLNLGQSVVLDKWVGRGTRTNHPEDYPEYVKGADIVSFDIYPATHSDPAVLGQLWMVAEGVDRLRKWTDDKKNVWTCIETTRISNKNVKPTPHQVEAEVWMSIIHGSRGLIYFAHTFVPQTIETGLLADKEMVAAVKQINAQVTSLAAVINSPAPKATAMVQSSDPKTPISSMTREYKGDTYIFAVAMRDHPTTATFKLAGIKDASVEVIGTDRKIPVTKGHFQDDFQPYDVRLYKITKN